MTYPARQDASTSANVPVALDVNTAPLDLGSEAFATVYVQLDSDNHAIFSSDNVNFYSGGIKWEPSQSNPVNLTITFVLATGITQLQRDHHENFLLGAVATVNNSQQQIGIVAASTRTLKDHFTVVKSDGTKHDPKIIVTPQ